MAYLLVDGDDYYPSGWAEDLVGKFDTVDAAIAAHKPSRYIENMSWANVLCLDTLTIVKYFYRGEWTNPD